MTTDTVVHVNIPDSPAIIYDFGFYPDTILTDLYITGSLGNQVVCNTNQPGQVSLTNTGTSLQSGTVIFSYDPALIGSLTIGNSQPIGSVQLVSNNGGRIEFTYSNLNPGQTITIEFFVLVPGLAAIGSLLNIDFSAFVNGTDTFEYNVQEVVVCAYDPNDKLVSPDREGPENYTLHDEYLNYTIRFQNTGTFAATDVVLLDTLDPNLDPSTFLVTGSSHWALLNTLFIDDSILSFQFLNINLPDSGADFEGSNGYVSFIIKADTGLADSTVIENSAGIYFDLNPPIITNTAINTLVTKLGKYIVVNTEVNICPEDQYYLPWGPLVDSSGVYSDTVPAVVGCDTIYNVDVTIHPNPRDTSHVTVCFGQNYTLPGGSVVSQSGTYYDTIGTVLATVCLWFT